MAPVLTIVDPSPEWHGSAYVGRRGEQDVLVLLGPEGTGRRLQAARETAQELMELEIPDLLTLRAIEDVDGRLAWVYDHVRGLSLHHTLDNEETLLSPRAAAEVVARVAAVQLALSERGIRHPGPDASDILLTRKGQVYISGAVGPFPTSPAFRPPAGEVGETAISWRLGVLLSQLVTGVAPAPPSEEGAHDALIRRVLIRAMSRPGAVLGDRYGDWLRGLLSWRADARPPLSNVSDGLMALAEATGGKELKDWCQSHFREVARQAERRDPRRRSGEMTGDFPVEPLIRPFSDSSISDQGETPTAPKVRVAQPGAGPEDLTLEDDPTIESMNVGPPRQPKPTAQLGKMPVSVGPPPEAVSTPPRLPSGFLDPEPLDTDGVARTSPPVIALTGALAVVISMVLAVIALFLLVYLLWPAG